MIPFFGRTAISWIVDVTTVGSTIIYCYTSAAALKLAHGEKNRMMIFCGGSGGAVIAFGMAEFRPETDKSFDSVFARADAAMYKEKKILKERF